MLANEFLGGLNLPFPILVLRLVGAALLCALIGYEREAGAHSAGLRTNMLVGLAAATFAVITLHLVDLYSDRGSDGAHGPAAPGRGDHRRRRLPRRRHDRAEPRAG